MAKKNLAGQINMFDVFKELERSAGTADEVEMVALMPEREPVSAQGEVVIANAESADKKNETKETKSVVGEECESDINDISAEAKIVDYARQNDTGMDKLPNENAEEIFGNAAGCVIKNNSDIAMHREKRDTDGSIVAEISYINYNKVLIRRRGHEDILKSFDNSYDAVDYYVSNMSLDNHE